MNVVTTKEKNNTNYTKNKNFVSSGILPFYTCKNGNKYILLGRETYSNTCVKPWSPFSGVREKNETCLETAHREFREESLECIPLKYKTPTEVLVSAFENKLEHQKFQTMLFLYEIDNSKTMIQVMGEFVKKRERLLHLSKQIKRFKHRLCFLSREPCFCHINGYVKIKNQTCKIIFVHNVSFDESTLNLISNLILKYNEEYFRYTMKVDVPKTHRVQARLYYNFYRDYENFMNSIVSMPDRDYLVYRKIFGHIVDFEIRKEYMEKSSIYFYSTQEIEMLLHEKKIKKNYTNALEAIVKLFNSN